MTTTGRPRFARIAPHESPYLCVADGCYTPPESMIFDADGFWWAIAVCSNEAHIAECIAYQDQQIAKRGTPGPIFDHWTYDVMIAEGIILPPSGGP